MGARSLDKLEKIVNEIKSKGGNAFSYYLDLLDDKSIQNFIKNVHSVGSVRTLINNSGFGKFDKISLILITLN